MPSIPCFAALALLVGLILAVPQSMAVEEMREFNKDNGKKSGKVKTCPRGAQFSEKKRGCVKISCGTGPGVEQRALTNALTVNRRR